MNQPSVFISCVSPEFGHTRSRVAEILTRLGYTPVIQEIFGTEPGDLRQVLRTKIDACEGLIQIVGQGYGGEPPTIDTAYGRVSYSQFEFLYARSQKKKTWLLFAGKACTRDTPLERLDLPNDPADPNPTGYQAERQALQHSYCEQRRRDGHLYYDASSDPDLELKVERLRDELAGLRQPFKLWQKKVLGAFALGFVLLALIGGSVWWFGFLQHHEFQQQHDEIQQISADTRHITREKIRAQLLESVERARQAALGEAEKAESWKERERLRQAAEKAYAGSVSRIDELAASFAEIEGTDRSTDVFNEMTRILAGPEGVDQAISYVATQRAAILEKVKARTTDAHKKNRSDLLPLLKSAQLEAERNHPAEAEQRFREILAPEPDWSEPRNALAQFLIQRGEVIEPAQGNAKLREAVQVCQGTLALNPREKSPQDWAATQNNLGNALEHLGRHSGGGEGRRLLREAAAAYQSALEVRTRSDLPQDWAATRNNLGNVLWDLGTRSGGEEGRRLLTEAVAAYRSAQEVRTKADLPQAWAGTQNNLGNVLGDLGTRSGGEEGRKLLTEAIAAYRSALEVWTKADLPQAWAMTQNNLGTVLADLGRRSGGEEGRKLLAEAVAACRSALEVCTKADLPQAWAMTQNNLGDALKDLGTRSGREEGRKLLAEAVTACRSALEVYTKADLPQAWAITQNNLGDTLRELGMRSDAEKGCKLLAEAVAACRSALEVYTKADLPQDWVRTQNNLGIALWDHGDQLKGGEGLKRQRESVEAFREVMAYQPSDQSRLMLAQHLGDFAFNLVLNRQFAEAQTQCQEAQRLANDIGDGIQKTNRDNLIFIQQNLAHALLFQGRYDEALAIYRRNWEKPLDEKTFGQITLQDFATFDKAGLSNPDLARMKQALGELGPEVPSP
jgi:tetratricopeptide (TPR) repeat protein